MEYSIVQHCTLWYCIVLYCTVLRTLRTTTTGRRGGLEPIVSSVQKVKISKGQEVYLQSFDFNKHVKQMPVISRVLELPKELGFKGDKCA